MKTKLLLFVMLLSFTTYAQTIASFTSDPMSDFSIVNPAAAIDQSPTGVNAVWNFQLLVPGGTNIDTYAAPTAAQLATYPGTTEVMTITTQGAMPVMSDFFLKEDGTGTSITGVSQGDIVLNYSTTNAFVGLFPLNFGANNSGNVGGTFAYQGTNGTFTGTFTATVDGYGTLTLADGLGWSYTGNVTRLRIDQNLSFSIPPIFNNIGTLTQTTYYYYDNDANNIAFRYTNANVTSAFLGINQNTETFERSRDVTLSRNSSIENAEFQLFPNPANDIITININEEISNLTITDIQGREVFNTTQNISTVPVRSLHQGMYFVNITTISGKSATKKFIKN